MKYFGAAYYPEQLDPAEIRPDARLMQEAGFNLVRLGEFAWSRLEPAEERFEFDWLESVVAIMADHGIRSLLCTPTAAPPKWLMDQCEEIYPVDVNGQRREFGLRRHYCVNNGEYHRHTRRIVTALAERFKNNVNVIGYQLDNEFMAEQPHCYCATCRRAFQAWLRAKFGTVEALNRRWGTAFWSQSYRRFEEVVLPKPGHNPSAMLDLHRFFSDAFLEYARLQSGCLKAVSPEKIVTHNICSSGFLYRLDLHRLGAQLDVVAVDNYPLSWTLENESGNREDVPYHPAMASLALAIIRGLRHAPFWVTEAQTGRTFRPRQLPEPGMIRVWTQQEIAHGAEAVLWFHWRQFSTGGEHLLQAVLECDGKPRRRYFEIQETIRELRAAAPKLAGALPCPDVAIIRDFDCDWALDDGRTHPDFKYLRHLYIYYRALFEQHVNADIIQPLADLHRYKVVIAPALVLMDETRTAHLRQFVQAGGTLVITVQSGLRNLDNGFHRTTLPAGLTDLCGLEIEEQNALKFKDTTGLAPVDGGYSQSRYEASLLFELVTLTTARTLFHYTDLWFAGTPAITVNPFGKGTVYYIATIPPVELIRELFTRILTNAKVLPNLSASSSPMVESVKTFKAGKEFLHLINYTRETQTVRLAEGYESLTGDESCASTVELKPFGTAMLPRVSHEL